MRVKLYLSALQGCHLQEDVDVREVGGVIRTHPYVGVRERVQCRYVALMSNLEDSMLNVVPSHNFLRVKVGVLRSSCSVSLPIHLVRRSRE